MGRKQVLMSVEKIDELKKILDQLPQKQSGKTPQEVALVLAKDVEKAVKKGYTIKELIEILNKEGKLETSFQHFYRHFPKRQRKAAERTAPKITSKSRQQKPVTAVSQAMGFATPDLPDEAL